MLTAADLREGDLVAVPSSAGARWLGLIERAWTARAALLPVDDRLSGRERASVLDRAGPTVLFDGADDWARLRSGIRVSPDAAFVFATSGTSGMPKLVELGREAVRAAVDGSTRALAAAPNDVWVSCLSPGHVGGMLVLLRAALAGAIVRIHRRFTVDTVAETAGDFVSLVPTMLARLLDAGADLGRYRAILVGGGRLRPDLRERAGAAGARVVETYGLTESCGGVVYDGTPFPGMSVRIDQGAIELRGPTTMTGYLDDRAATAEVFTNDGWLRTGDAGRLDAEGRLHVAGRLDDVINSGGEKVWPQDVETALGTHRKVSDVAVAGRPDPDWGERVVAFVVPADPADPPRLEELRDHVSAQIARFKAPRELVLVGSLPRTASGKLRRRALAPRRSARAE